MKKHLRKKKEIIIKLKPVGKKLPPSFIYGVDMEVAVSELCDSKNCKCHPKL